MTAAGEVKRLICLANSRKLSGRCIAGKDETGAWVRPISARPHEEVSEWERAYRDGSDPRVLDVIDVPLIGPRPRGYQSENWLIDPTEYWILRGKMPFDDLETLVDEPQTLWTNGSSTYHGKNDRVALSDTESLPNSLFLLPVGDLRLYVLAPGKDFGDPKRRVHGAFSYRGVAHRLWVTDPIVEREYLAKEDGQYPIGQCYLSLSLGEPFEGYCYKLVAAVITSPSASSRL